ncbi:MAG: inorganic diphosphatase [Ignavibacteria bacterium]|nr:inorganic diphosphatase [Ignavibacteria bacterium]
MYEIEKQSGFLKSTVRKNIQTSVPLRTDLFRKHCALLTLPNIAYEKTGRKNIVGDGDPLDICVVTEKSLNHSRILLQAIPIGGLRLIDNNEADDKIIAVMKNDAIFSEWKDIGDCSESFIERLKHYFLTYKDAPGSQGKRCEIESVYGKDEAL